jgi:hypothetical protein
MKDKRQRMAFNWPLAYGDPQMLAYMLQAVAQSAYSGSSNTNQTHQQTSSQSGEFLRIVNMMVWIRGVTLTLLLLFTN